MSQLLIIDQCKSKKKKKKTERKVWENIEKQQLAPIEEPENE